MHPRSERFPTHRASAALALLVLLAGFLAGPRAAADPEPANPARLPLWPDKAPDGAGGWGGPENSGLTIHLAPKPNGMAVIICPGGAYSGLVTGPEGHGIARWLNQHGILGAVLEYRLPAGRSKVPLLDAQQAIRSLRSNARALKIDPKRVGILGFSAGGHLAATASTQFDLGKVEAGDPLAGQSSRPDFTLLVYPVISMGDLTHVGVRDNLLGKKPTPEEIRRFSCDLQVTALTPPAFLAHAVDDRGVLIDNSRLYHQALRSQGIASRLVELPDGGHGLNGYRGSSWDTWQREAILWLKSR